MKYFILLLILIHTLTLSLSAQSINSNLKPTNTVTMESIKTRRSLLNWHQLAGLTTISLWLATNLEGEKTSDSLYRKSDEFAKVILLTKPDYATGDPLYAIALGEALTRHSIAADYLLLKDPINNAPLYFALKSNEEWEARHTASLHKNLASATFGAYVLTASLAYFAPSRIESEDSSSGAKIYSPLLAHKAMIPIHMLSMLLLPGLGAKIGKDGPSAAQHMSDVGWAGFGALSIAILVITF